MILAYNLSNTVKANLDKIESLRTSLLTLPISPKNELRLKWEASLQKTYWSLVLSANPLTKTQMTTILSKNISVQTQTKLKKHQKEVINYKKALNYISTEWLVNGRPVTINSFKALYDIACKETISKPPNITKAKKVKLTSLFEYLHSNSESPVIQAGISQIQMILIAPLNEGNGRLARLIPYLYLYKRGYDCRGMVVIDEYLGNDLVKLKLAIESVKKTNNLTLWLEYFTKGLLEQLQRAYDNASVYRFSSDLPQSYWKLNDRQKEVLDMLTLPGSRVTNKAVQMKFKVSQITASRDLSHLSSLDLTFVHGKGRSTYYVRA